MFEQNIYASIRERCSNAFVEHVIACDNSLKKSCVRAENFFEKGGGKNLNLEDRE